MTLNADAASSAASPTTPELSLPEPVGFGAPLTDAKSTSGSSPEIENSNTGNNAGNSSVSSNVSSDSSADVTPPAQAPEVKPDAKKPENLLEVIKDVVARDKAKAEQSSSSEEGKSVESQMDADGDAKVDPNAPEDDSKLPFHNHPRFRQIVQERNSFKEAATQYNQVVQFMQSNSLNAQEVAQGMQIMALMKNDPLKALEALKPTVARLQQFSGEILPQDIAEKVNKGFLDEESAQELAKQRNQAALLESRRQAEVEAYQASQQQEQAQAHFNSMLGAVQSWETQQKTRDPDYQAKSKFIEDRMKVLLQQYQPRNQQEAVAIAEKAYSDVNESFRGINPRRQPVQNVNSSLSSISAKPVPKTLRDVVRQAIGR